MDDIIEVFLEVYGEDVLVFEFEEEEEEVWV